MGDTARAKDLSSRFKNRTLKAIALYGFDKCGNCVSRIRCGEEILKSGGKENPIHFIVYSMLKGCPTAKYSSIGFLPREISEFLHGECAKCNKLDICTGYLAQHVGLDSPEGKKKVLERFETCLNCKDLDNCINHYMMQMNISKVNLLKHAFLMKFKDCSQYKKMTISLDLPPDTKGANVGSAIKRNVPPEK